MDISKHQNKKLFFLEIFEKGEKENKKRENIKFGYKTFYSTRAKLCDI